MVQKIQKILAVEGVRTCVRSRERLIPKSNQRKFDNANSKPIYKHSQECLAPCNRQTSNQKRDICIPKDICKRSSQSDTYSCSIKQFKLSVSKMSTHNSPEKSNPKMSTIVNTSTPFGNVSLNIVLNRAQIQATSLVSDSNIEVIPPKS